MQRRYAVEHEAWESWLEQGNYAHTFTGTPQAHYLFQDPIKVFGNLKTLQGPYICRWSWPSNVSEQRIR